MKRLGILAIGVAISFNVIHIESASAAQFEFGFGEDYLNGQLSFEGSPLTGIGLETAKLSQLQANNFGYLFPGFPATADPPYPYLSGFNGDPIFTFNNGELIGINLNTSLDYSEVSYGGSSAFSVNGVHTLFLQGNTYEQRFTGVTIFGGYDIETQEFFEEITNYQNQVISAGSIEFRTIEKVASVPEPSSVLGIGTAAGVAVLLKRRVNRLKEL